MSGRELVRKGLRQWSTYKQPLVEAVARLRPPRDRAERADEAAAATQQCDTQRWSVQIPIPAQRMPKCGGLGMARADRRLQGCAYVQGTQGATPSSVLNGT